MTPAGYAVSLSRLAWAVVRFDLAASDPALALRIDGLLLESAEMRPVFVAPSRGVLAAIAEAFGRMDARQRQLEVSR